MNIIKKKSIDLIKNKQVKVKEKKLKYDQNNIYIKIDSCGICSSDLKFIKSGSRIKKFPITLGERYSFTWSPFGELVKQYLHLRLHALLRFRSMPLVLVPTFPSFFLT